MKRLIYILMFFSLLSACAADARDISVLLASNASQCKIGGTAYVIRVASGAVTPSITGSFSLMGAGSSLKAGAVKYALPVTVASSNPIIIDGVSYHGSIIFEASSSGFNIVNRLNVEDYLRGVLKDEMAPGWPAEALKAQAVLARTYTLASKKHGKYDVCAKVHCQSYGGTANEAAALTAAVNATAGEILKYNGAPAEVCFYGDSGGYGTSAKSVWGKNVTYLQARPDPVRYTSPNSRWQTNVPMSQIESRLAAAGVSTGKISSIAPYSRDESGRVTQLVVNCKAGRKIITGAKFRAALGAGVVKSTLFEFGQPTPYTPSTVSVPTSQRSIQTSQTVQTKSMNVDRSTMPNGSDLDKLYWMQRNGVFTLQELVSMIGKERDYPKFVAEGEARMKGKKTVVVQQPTTTVQTTVQSVASGAPRLSMRAASGSSVTISGRGSGHGVGMPQWTAKAMAEAGWNYRQILEYYFHGTTLGQ